MRSLLHWLAPPPAPSNRTHNTSGNSACRVSARRCRICFAPIGKVSALKCRNVTESSASEFTFDAARLVAADYLDTSFLVWSQQQQIAGTLVRFGKAVAADNNSVTFVQGGGCL